MRKKSFQKESPGTKSGGKTFRVDKAAQTFVNGHFKKILLMQNKMVRRHLDMMVV